VKVKTLTIALLLVLLISVSCNRPRSEGTADNLEPKPKTVSQNASFLPLARVCSTPPPRSLPAAVSHVESMRPHLFTGLVIAGSAQQIRSAQAKSDKAFEAVLNDYVWKDPQNKVRHEFTVKFLSGEPLVQQRIKNVAQIWSTVANVKFNFVDSGDADIRIGVDNNGLSWSMVGNQAAESNQPAESKDMESMHYGWLDRATPQAEYQRTVLHEFGHALGAIHEHQSPGGHINWNVDVVHAWCASNNPPWSVNDCDDNIINQYSAEKATFTRLDPSSIMVYSFPPEWTTDGTSMPMNWQISNDDKALMATIYGAPAQ
jgi:hypothetical protein